MTSSATLPDNGEDLVVRGQRPGERAKVREGIVGAFGESVVADLAEALQDGPAGRHGLSLVADPRYYSRFGFRAAADLGFTAASVRVPAAAFQVVIQPAHEPWMTGALVYAEPFWALDCVGLRAGVSPESGAG